MTKSIGSFRVGPSKHIQCFGVPEIETLLHSLSRFAAFSSDFSGLIRTETDMPHLLFQDLRQDALQRQIATVEEFFELVAADPVD